MTTFTRTWNPAYEASPADSQNASQGAARIREIKNDVSERLEIDHSWAGDVDDGTHLKVTFVDPLAVKPVQANDETYLYTKDVDGTSELFYEDEAGNEVQLTLGGVINPAAITKRKTSEIIDNLLIDASVATNILTVDVKTLANVDATATDFIEVSMRDSTLTDGIFNIRTITGALTIDVPAGATLGYLAGETHEVQVFLIDNAGTLELAIMYAENNVNHMPDETGVISTTILGVGSDSAGVLYSTTARTDVPIRHIGSIKIQTDVTTAGNWSNAPTIESTRHRPAIQNFQLPAVVLGDDNVIRSNITTDAVGNDALTNTIGTSGEQTILTSATWTPASGWYNFMRTSVFIGLIQMRLYTAGSWELSLATMGLGFTLWCDGTNMEFKEDGTSTSEIAWQKLD